MGQEFFQKNEVNSVVRLRLRDILDMFFNQTRRFSETRHDMTDVKLVQAIGVTNLLLERPVVVCVHGSC
ncbi:unnamed protein product [Allacma fusca]|uniref:Uncharacterized protein n=1 Tax=Allacma fusca TaxID=39272 RepID=A0A8J2JFT7_9HEXA|nr:unnamed protein product [Allacma fusca]